MNLAFLYPLQISATDFNMDSTATPRDIIIGFSVLAAIVVLLVLLNSRKGGIPSGKKSGKGSSKSASIGGSSIFAMIKLRGIANNIGLNNEQAKMLDFAFRIDAVQDPEKSITTPALLDRHFRKAFRYLEQSGSGSENQRKIAVLFSVRNILENSAYGAITSTAQIREDTVFTIVSGKDKMNINVLSAKGEYLLVEAPKTVLGSQVKMQRGTKLNVLFFNKSNKGFSFETKVIGYSTKDGRSTMQLSHSNRLRFLSQRRFRRRQAVIPGSLYLVLVEGSGKKQRLIVDKRQLKGNIADISIGGCSVKMMSPVQVGARFKIECIVGDSDVAALGQVLRTNRTGMNTIIHIKFLKLSQKSMNAINSFVYEYARE
ncbi:MAG: PilZ domain-containing protein [Treponema sp.]|nr:PilZ domain-containing protein [Treponema sp.]